MYRFLRVGRTQKEIRPFAEYYLRFRYAPDGEFVTKLARRWLVIEKSFALYALLRRPRSFKIVSFVLAILIRVRNRSTKTRKATARVVSSFLAVLAARRRRWIHRVKRPATWTMTYTCCSTEILKGNSSSTPRIVSEAAISGKFLKVDGVSL